MQWIFKNIGVLRHTDGSQYVIFYGRAKKNTGQDNK
jgi:hypothetical protein